MLTRRLIVCLDVDAGRVAKGTCFRDLRYLADPADMAEQYEADGADEIVFLDISASAEGRATMLDAVERTARRLTIPLTVGGGVRSVADVALTLRSGADKVAVNTAAVDQPTLVSDATRRFGAQCIVVSVDAFGIGDEWQVATHGGRRRRSLDAVQWAVQAVALGAGELLVTSIDRDGTRRGYDNALIRAIVERVSVPVIASGGAGNAQHLVDAFKVGQADAVLVAGILHDRDSSVPALKSHLAKCGIPVRVT
jgi:cyclase